MLALQWIQDDRADVDGVVLLIGLRLVAGLQQTIGRFALSAELAAHVALLPTAITSGRVVYWPISIGMTF
ncbi:MAG: hypothetical protein ABJB66_19475 [Gemmatimonadaceae bacterium]